MKFQDGSTLNDETIGEIVGAVEGLPDIDLTGLVTHLRDIGEVYPEVFVEHEALAPWAHDCYNWWQDPYTPHTSEWP